jgi:outer membrane lipoprotein SlyB
LSSNEDGNQLFLFKGVPMTTEQSASSTQSPTRARLHPLVALAAVAVAAVSLIAAAQFLAPKAALSQPSAQPVAEVKPGTAKTAATKATKPAAAAVCMDCGVVIAVREMKQAGEGTGVGVVAGGVLGGVVGHQIGGGRGKDLATAAGVVGGAIAGHQVEKQARAKIVYQVDVKMDNGSLRTLTQATPFAVGAKVRVAGDQITQRG